ncbi:MAG: hypothetical protein KDA24_22205 [Deltaproteobacteria bacterium]|nr:hypothetical protein [Deltaproteobacteria bacterium]
MKYAPFLALAIPFAACSVPDLESPADIAELCAERTQQAIAFDVFIDDRDGCSWGEDGNIAEDQGVYTAREDERYLVDGMENTVFCTLDFDFNGDFEYEDDFFLTWNDAVLVTNRGRVVDEFSEWLRYPLWEWEDIVELEIPTSQTFSPFCAGEDEGDADCEVPRKPQGEDWEDDLQYEPDPVVVHELAFRSQSLGMTEFGLITTGDNDDDDCSHEELDLEVTGSGIVF